MKDLETILDEIKLKESQAELRIQSARSKAKALIDEAYFIKDRQIEQVRNETEMFSKKILKEKKEKALQEKEKILSFYKEKASAIHKQVQEKFSQALNLIIDTLFS